MSERKSKSKPVKNLPTFENKTPKEAIEELKEKPKIGFMGLV